MMIIVGLGNPGEKFNHTRHNVGFEALDFFAAAHQFPDFKISKKYSQAKISENENIVLVKPQTFMNDSGRVAYTLLKNKDAPLVVVHDDIDMPLGKIKFSKDSGSGGHKGVESIIHLVGKDFIRLKIGIATNDQKAADIVLKKFNKEEQKILADVIEKSTEALDYLIENGIEKAMNKFN